MMLPFIRTLQKKFPEAKLTWVISKSFYPIVSKLEGVEFICVDKVRSWSDFQKARQVFKGHSFDILFAMQASFSANLLYPLISATRKIGFPRARSKDLHSLFTKESIPSNPDHTVDLFLEFAHYIGATETCYEGEVPLTAEEKVPLYHEPYYILHPCSSMPVCDWPTDRYIALAKVLYAKYGFKLLLTGAPKDIETVEKIRSNVPYAESLAGKTTLRQMASLIFNAKFVIAPDTGPLHIASSFQKPTIGLYATSSPQLTGPYFSLDTVVNKYEEMKELLKGEGGKIRSPRIYDKRAMELILVDEVLEKIETSLSRKLVFN